MAERDKPTNRYPFNRWIKETTGKLSALPPTQEQQQPGLLRAVLPILIRAHINPRPPPPPPSTPPPSSEEWPRTSGFSVPPPLPSLSPPPPPGEYLWLETIHANVEAKWQPDWPRSSHFSVPPPLSPTPASSQEPPPEAGRQQWVPGYETGGMSPMALETSPMQTKTPPPPSPQKSRRPASDITPAGGKPAPASGARSAGPKLLPPDRPVSGSGSGGGGHPKPRPASDVLPRSAAAAAGSKPLEGPGSTGSKPRSRSKRTGEKPKPEQVPGPPPPSSRVPKTHEILQMQFASRTVRISTEWLEFLTEKGYRLVRQLGSGTYGVVFEAWKDQGRDPPIHAAIKFISTNSEPQYLKVEVMACQGIRHRFVVKTLEVHCLSNVVMISHEYAVADLANFMSSLAPDSEYHRLDRKLIWFAQMADANAYLNGNCLVHRDIKPTNFLVVMNEQNVPVVKIYDFGLSLPCYRWLETYGKLKQQGKSQEEIRQAMLALREASLFMDYPTGTLYFMAPEVVLVGYKGPGGVPKYDVFKADIFSLGLTYHCVLFDGRLPGVWNSGHRLPHYQAIHNTDWQKVWAECRQIGGDALAELMMAMLDLDPNKRPHAHDILKFRIFTESEMVQQMLKNTPHIMPYIDLFQ